MTKKELIEYLKDLPDDTLILEESVAGYFWLVEPATFNFHETTKTPEHDRDFVRCRMDFAYED